MSGVRQRVTGAIRKGRRPRSRKTAGLLVLLALIGFGVFSFQRQTVQVALASGDTTKAEFSRAYKLQPYQSVVKIAGVKVGTVTGVETTERRTALVSMKLDDGTVAKLGTEPSASVRPALVVGGAYYVELAKGGTAGAYDPDRTIPVERTSVPVELDQVLTAITADAQRAIQGTVGHLDQTLRQGGRAEIQELLAAAPGTLTPAGEVLAAARGTNPATDLADLVGGLQGAASALTERDGQLDSIITSLNTTSATLAGQRVPIAEAIKDGPQTLRTTKAGLADLDGTLDRLTRTAEKFRPTARELDPLLGTLDPVLVRAQPVVNDLRALAADARPLVEGLVPTAKDATAVLTDVRGPVLERLNGPITEAVLSPWHGEGVYQGGGNDHRLYQEAAYLLSHGADVFKFHDKNGAAGRLMAGVGLSVAGGIVPMSIEQYLESLGLQQPVGPQEGTNESGPGLIPPPAAGNGSGGPGAVLPPLQLPLVSRSSR